MRTMLKISVIFLFISTFGACTKDEVETTGGISGTVTSLDNEEPLSGGNVSLNPGGKAATTGSNGRYEFQRLEPGQYTVQVMCKDHKTNTKRITVVAGETAVGDIQLEMGAENFKLSDNQLQFVPGNTENSFSIINTSISQSIDWKVLSGYPSWLSVSETQGTLSKGGKRDITVSLAGSPAAGSEGYITVEVAGSTLQVYVAVKGSDEGDSGDGSDSSVSGTVTSCDSRIVVKMTAFRMSGSTAILEYTLRNDGEDMAGFRLRQYKCEIHDDSGTGYDTGSVTKVFYELGTERVFNG